MSEVFGPVYAAAYDLLYAEKDYEAECDVIERAFAEFSAEPVRRILDLGCGTGGHAVPLARRGYDVVGMDRSPGMLAAARAKAEAAHVASRITFVPGDVTCASNVAPCDAALMMFAVLGYQASLRDLSEALRSTRSNLRAGGLLLFDVWHAPAIHRVPPTPRWKMVERDGARVLRLSSGRLDRAASTCAVTIRVLTLVGDRLAGETVEQHCLRYFAREELVEALHGSGMELLRLGRFPEYWREPDDSIWSVVGIARAIG